MTGDITLYSPGGKIHFGREGYILHEIESAPPKIQSGTPGQRAVTVRGYILPEGEDDAARGKSLSALSRRVVRLVTAEDGFYMDEGGRTLHLYATEVPDFSREAPFAEGDAAYFTIRAISAEGDPFYIAGKHSVSSRGMAGRLVFPLSVTENTVMAELSRQGEIIADNPGDVKCGFTLSVLAEDGPLTSFTLSLGEEFVRVDYPLPKGKVLTVSTLPGKKNVYSEGNSLMAYVDWNSTFFSLSPGENRIAWQAEGEGYPHLTLACTPLYL